MQSLTSALSNAFGIAPRHVKSGTSGLEIDRFDGWQLTSASGYLPLVTCGKGNEEDEDSDKA